MRYQNSKCQLNKVMSETPVYEFLTGANSNVLFRLHLNALSSRTVTKVSYVQDYRDSYASKVQILDIDSKNASRCVYIEPNLGISCFVSKWINIYFGTLK